MPFTKKPFLPPEMIPTIKGMYESGASLETIRKALFPELWPETFRKRFHRAGIETRDIAEATRTAQSRILRSKNTANRLRGEHNPAWKGGIRTTDASGRAQASLAHPNAPGHCHRCKRHTSQFKRIERHHIDRNPRNNAKENIQWLCTSCHRITHLREE